MPSELSASGSRRAVIDVGSNTVHLLVADSDGHRLVSVDDVSARLRLGADVTRAGRFEQQTIRVAAGTVRDYVERARELQPACICLLGTQALRASANGSELVTAVERSTGIPLRIISPETEARLGYLGTTLDVLEPPPRLTIDIGGGSTQLTLVDTQGRPHFQSSLPIGSVVLPARFLRHDPPTTTERQRLEMATRQALSATHEPSASANAPEYGVVVGGVGWRLRWAGRLNPGDRLSRAFVERLASVALEVSSEAMAVLGACFADDAAMIRAGAVVLREVMNARRLQYCLVSDKGVREGAILTLARGEDIGYGS